LESDNKELFRLARKFEHLKRNFGIHASGVLILPFAATQIVPIRIDKDTGVAITFFTGTEVEELNCVG